MAYIVTDKCIKCKYTDCVDVCPVDCFYEGKNMLVINPEECIDCGVCVPECPIEAIVPDSESSADLIELNGKYSKLWPVITRSKAAMDEADKHAEESDKINKYFKENLDSDA